MQKTVEVIQKTACMGKREDWYAPWIEVEGKWRIVNNYELIRHPGHLNRHDRYREAIFRIKTIMEDMGWKTELSEEKQCCHEHLYYRHYRLKCGKQPAPKPN